MDRTLKYDHSLESSLAVFYCGAVCFLVLPSLLSWKIYQFCTWHCEELKGQYVVLTNLKLAMWQSHRTIY